MSENTNHFEPIHQPDIREVLGGFEMDVQLQTSDIVFDPANIVFIVLPKIWTIDEYKEIYNIPPNDTVKELITTQTPFVPGIKPYGAWVLVFNPLELKGGSGILTYDSDTSVWREDEQKGRIKFRDPNALVNALAEKLEIEQVPLDEDQIKQHLEELEHDEIVQVIVNRVLSLLPRIVTGRNFEDNVELKNELLLMLLKIHYVNQDPGDLTNQDMWHIYNDLKDFLSKNIPKSALYRYQKPLLVSECLMDFDSPNKGTLLLI